MNNTKLLYALAIYITGLFASNLLGMKTMPFLFDSHISFAVFTMPLLFVTTDVVGQVYGKEMSKKFVLIGTLALIIFLVLSVFSQSLPWDPRTYARIGEAYENIFSVSLRMTIASILAFSISEYVDVIVFFAVKKMGNFAFSSTCSNIVSQFLDTAIFMFIAFWGVFDFATIVAMSFPWWIYKVGAGVLYMPLSFVVLKYLKNTKN